MLFWTTSCVQLWYRALSSCSSPGAGSHKSFVIICLGEVPTSIMVWCIGIARVRSPKPLKDVGEGQSEGKSFEKLMKSLQCMHICFNCLYNLVFKSLNLSFACIRLLHKESLVIVMTTQGSLKGRLFYTAALTTSKSGNRDIFVISNKESAWRMLVASPKLLLANESSLILSDCLLFIWFVP